MKKSSKEFTDQERDHSKDKTRQNKQHQQQQHTPLIPRCGM